MRFDNLSLEVSIDRLKIIGTGLFILFILSMVLFIKDSVIPNVKTDATRIVFVLIFPQMFAGISIFRAIFVKSYTYFRIYHRIFGYLIIGIFITISSICIYVYIPGLRGIRDLRTIVHMIFGVFGYVIFPLKLYQVTSKKRSAYNINTAILGTIFIFIMMMMFITEVLLI